MKVWVVMKEYTDAQSSIISIERSEAAARALLLKLEMVKGDHTLSISESEVSCDDSAK